jgi:transcription initiation factor IIE alpha subunit
MLCDCTRCGHGWKQSYQRNFERNFKCPVCAGMTDEQAQFVLAMRNDLMRIRRIARKALWNDDLTAEELSSIGIYTEP